MTDSPDKAVDIDEIPKLNHQAMESERKLLFGIIESLNRTYRRGDPLGEMIKFVSYLLLISLPVLGLSVTFGRSFLDAVVFAVILSVVLIAVALLVHLFWPGSARWGSLARTAILGLFCLAVAIWWRFDIIDMRRDISHSVFLFRMNANALASTNESTEAGATVINGYFDDVGALGDIAGREFNAEDFNRCKQPNRYCNLLREVAEKNGLITRAADTRFLLEAMAASGKRRLRNVIALDAGAENGSGLNEDSGSPLDIFLIGSEITIEAGTKILLGRSRLHIVAARLVVEGDVEVKAFERSLTIEGVAGSGKPGLHAGTLDLMIIDNIFGEGKLKVDLRGQDGNAGLAGKAGASRLAGDIPPKSAEEGEWGFFPLANYEKNFLEPRLAKLPSDVRAIARDFYLKTIGDCGSNSNCKLLICAKPAGDGKVGYQGLSGAQGDPGGLGGDSGTLQALFLRGEGDNRNSHFEMIDGVADSGAGGPGGPGGVGGAGGQGGSPDVLGACLDGPNGVDGPEGEHGIPGRKPPPTAKPTTVRFGTVCLAVYLGTLGPDSACSM